MFSFKRAVSILVRVLPNPPRDIYADFDVDLVRWGLGPVVLWTRSWKSLRLYIGPFWFEIGHEKEFYV